VLTAGRVYHWPLGRDIAVHVVPQGDADGALRAALGRAAGAWTATLRYRELRLHVVASASDADVVLGYAGEPFPVRLDVCGGIGIPAAFTLPCPSGDSVATLPLRDGAPGRVKIAIVVNGDAVTSPGQLDAVVTHELGHALGIGGHSDAAGDVMYADPRSARPSARDAATLRYVLHRPADLRL
jgi:predicted Zn-dependent protease